MIEQERIEAIKRSVDLAALIRSRGVELNRNGKGIVGRCPFHDDKNPSLSVNPAENLWQCFGCGAAGDVIRFVELFDKVPFPDPVKRLSSVTAPPEARRKPAEKPDRERSGPAQQTAGETGPELSVKNRKLLARAAAYYQHSLGEDPRGLRYLKEERGITDHQTGIYGLNEDFTVKSMN